MTARWCPILVVAAAAALVSVASGAAERPYILWTRSEATALKRLIETQDWARKQYETMGRETGTKGSLETNFRDLFAYTVMGDRAGGERQKAHLMGFADERPEGKSRYYSPYEHALRYDTLYDLLSPDERKAVEAVFRRFVDFHLKSDKPPFFYNREAFLPNMQWNLVMGTHLMAVALGDEALIRAMFASNGGWKWYMDEYVADGEFYFEEFGKYYSMITEMVLWCRGLERLGLDELGYGYTGKGGANMRNYLRSMLRLAYPRIGGALRPTYPCVSMGDAGDLHSVVAGYAADGTGGNARWGAARMNGGVPRMRHPLWFEVGHAKWPDDGFDFLLSRMRPPDSDKYYPSLFFLHEPVDPAKAKLAPSPSFVAAERGFAVLRADESPSYWDGPAPVVTFQFATYCMHYTSDCFSLLQFIANNRLLYCRRGVARGYGGGCPWTDSVRSQTGVVVDGLRARAVGRVPSRSGFDPLVKFTAAHGKPLQPYPPVPADDQTSDHNQQGCYRAMRRSMGSEIYPGVNLERALFLTREYLFDVYRLASQTPRHYRWQAQVCGRPVHPASEWTKTDELTGRLYGDETVANQEKPGVATNDYYQLKDVRRFDPGANGFRVAFRQGETNAPPQETGGVRIHLVGEPGTLAYSGRIAGHDRYTFIAARQATSTVFTAVHEPFEGTAETVSAIRTIQMNADGIGVAITGPHVNDRVFYRYFGEHDKPLTLSNGEERVTFADRAYIRIHADRVEASGDLRAVALRVTGTPKLVMNGKETPARVANGVLTLAAQRD
jgi:hypothetical protein